MCINKWLVIFHGGDSRKEKSHSLPSKRSLWQQTAEHHWQSGLLMLKKSAWVFLNAANGINCVPSSTSHSEVRESLCASRQGCGFRLFVCVHSFRVVISGTKSSCRQVLPFLSGRGIRCWGGGGRCLCSHGEPVRTSWGRGACVCAAGQRWGSPSQHLLVDYLLCATWNDIALEVNWLNA